MVRRPEAVRWGPAARRSSGWRQRRKSTGTQGQAGGAGERGWGRRQGPGQARQRPAVGGDQRVVVAGVGQARRAGEPSADRPAEAAPGVDLAAGGDGRDRGDSSSATSAARPDLLDARRPPLRSSLAVHRRDARRRGARVARTVSRLRAGE